MKKIIGIFVCMLLIGTAVLSVSGTELKQYTSISTLNDGNTLYVGGSGPGNYTKIQDAIDNASDGDTVFVYDDSSPYYENLDVNKIISLIGENRDTTIIDGSENGDVINIYADRVDISGFTIQNSGSNWNDAGIEMHSFYNTISGNNIMNNHDGIWLSRSTHIISRNIIDSNADVGIFLDYSSDNVITGNTILNNGDGIRFFGSSDNSNISGNIISSNTDNGINFFYYSNNNIISSNTIISNNGNGINLDESSNNTLTGNNISLNNDYGILLSDSSSNNFIFHNNFINNGENAYDEGDNTWDNGYPYGGNYWDDYVGDDFYNGPNQDIPGSDGIGDIPYEIPCEHGTDYYPLMHPFEQYYILDIDAPSQVNEEESFNVLVKSMGGTVIPDAIVEFRNECHLTDFNGIAQFIAPSLDEDTLYWINATKEGYTGDSETILVKDVPVWFNYAFVFGRLDNLTTEGEIITFEALNIRAITFFPFTFNHYTSGELITISKYYFGLVGARFIFAFCGLSYQPSKISMNKFSQNDSANEIIWLVAEVEGNPLRTKDVEMILLNESGEPQPDAEITFNEVNVEGYINPGDTFTVVAPSDGYYVFMLTHKISGATIYKSSLTHY